MKQTVYLVDDDGAVRDAMTQILASAGLQVKAFTNAKTFLDTFEGGITGCLVLDVCMPDISGLELQTVLAEREIHLPIIFLTGYGNVEIAVRTLQAGAFDFLEKPVAGALLLERVRSAIAISDVQRKVYSRAAAARARFDRLTVREREVMALLVTGQSNKEAGASLGISYRTVEVHRRRIMRKMDADTVADLMLFAAYSAPQNMRFPE